MKKVLSVVTALGIMLGIAGGSAYAKENKHEHYHKAKTTAIATVPAQPTVTTTTTPIPTTTNQTVLPPTSVGTYNDFGMAIRLDINPNNTNATQFKIYYGAGFNATTGLQEKTVSAVTNFTASANQRVVRTGVQATSYGWWTIRVVSVASNGAESTQFVTNVNVNR